VNWLEVTLTVNGELAEAVADVLARFAPNGVMTEQAIKYSNAEDLGTAVDPIAVRAYLPADENLEKTRLKLEEALFYLGMIQPIPTPVFTPIADRNWMEAWKVHYQPIPIGKRLIIVPAWLESPVSNRIPIRIDPGMAFGTGTHPTTQLCLELLETCSLKDADLIDIGCGSGILSIGALKMGAHFALGVDIDDASVKASQENAAANGIKPEVFAFELGSVADILSGSLQIRSGNSQLNKQASVVCANILAPVIIDLLKQGLARLVSPGGSLILSGILDQQFESVLSEAEKHGLSLMEKLQMGDWVALALRRSDN
jgi:ribosomal protein L11 methyltransferase